MHLKMSSAKWRPFCLGLDVLNRRLTPGGPTGETHATRFLQLILWTDSCGWNLWGPDHRVVVPWCQHGVSGLWTQQWPLGWCDQCYIGLICITVSLKAQSLLIKRKMSMHLSVKAMFHNTSDFLCDTWVKPEVLYQYCHAIENCR